MLGCLFDLDSSYMSSFLGLLICEVDNIERPEPDNEKEGIEGEKKRNLKKKDTLSGPPEMQKSSWWHGRNGVLLVFRNSMVCGPLRFGMNR